MTTLEFNIVCVLVIAAALMAVIFAVRVRKSPLGLSIVIFVLLAVIIVGQFYLAYNYGLLYDLNHITSTS